jgi:soluble lytic murein transglycosylase-like protein
MCGVREISRLRSRRRSAGFADVGALVLAIVVLAFAAHFVPPTPSPTIHPLPGGIINYYAVAGSRASGLDVALVRAVIGAESGGDPRAVSTAGAAGLMQLMPATGYDCGIHDRFDAAANVKCGSRTLALLIHHYNGSLATAIEAYNWGCGNVDRVGGGLSKAPSSTQRYVVGVIEQYDFLQHLSLVVVAPPAPAPARRRSPRRLSRRVLVLRPELELPFFLAALFATEPTIERISSL